MPVSYTITAKRERPSKLKAERSETAFLKKAQVLGQKASGSRHSRWVLQSLVEKERDGRFHTSAISVPAKASCTHRQ